ncbi:MAG: hypothetical protein QM602_01645 [Microbacterium sp.]
MDVGGSRRDAPTSAPSSDIRQPGTDADPTRTDTAELLSAWTPPPGAAAAARRGLGGWALTFSILGLVVSLFVGWGFPIGLVGIVMAAVALRRPAESRPAAGWALALGIVSVIYSAGWLLWAASSMDLLG